MAKSYGQNFPKTLNWIYMQSFMKNGSQEPWRLGLSNPADIFLLKDQS